VIRLDRARRPRARCEPIVKRSILTAAILAAFTSLAGPARAQESNEPPSAAWPVVGGLVAAGGAALVYRQARQARTGDPSCLRLDGGCFWLGLGGTLGEEAGGALIAYWGWRLGERAYALDSGKDVSGMRTFGLVAGGAALIAIYVGATYAAFAPFGCLDRNAGRVDYKCVGPKQYTAQLIGLSAVPVLLVAAPVASYAFGYEAAHRRSSGQPRTLSWRLAPMAVPSGSGLTVAGQF
jgi:hypothetical protein